jgi:hypothetical protein
VCGLILVIAGVASAAPTGVTLSINQGDSRTNSDVVWLYLTASTSNPPLQMRFSNWGFGVSSAWEPYFQKKLWMLEPAGTLNATKGVTVEVKDASGTATASDSIFVASPLNLQALAQKRWYASNVTQKGITGLPNAAALCFDGENLWVSNYNGNAVTRVRAADQVVGDTYAVGALPQDIVYDGTHLWAVGFSSTVTQLRCSDGGFVRTVSVGSQAISGVFDGRSVWVGSGDGRLYVINAADGSVTSTDVVGNGPHGMAFDGNYVWVALYTDSVVKKIRPSDFAVMGTYPVGTHPWRILFDGTNIWTGNRGDNTVTKLRAVDGANKGSFAVGTDPVDIAYDGATIWVANYGSGTVSKLRAADGTPWGTVTLPGGPSRLGFDGVNVWVGVEVQDMVVKL